MFYVPWEDQLVEKVSSLSSALEFLDLCRSPSNIEQAKETGALKDAHEQLELSSRQLIEFMTTVSR